MLEYLRLRKITMVTNSTSIQMDFPDLAYTPSFTLIAGLHYLSGSDLTVFFRMDKHEKLDGLLIPRINP